jgi:hypothetical protein
VKKIIVILLVLSMLLSLLVPIIANAEPEDIFLSSGKALKALGVLVGNENGDLMLNDKLKRQDMVVLMSRLYNKEDSARTFLLKPSFTDITNKFYEPYIKWAVDKGLIVGMNESTFGFNQLVTVKQFMTVLLRALGYEEEAKLWDTVPELANTLGIMKGLELNPDSSLTRGQMAVMTLNTLKLTIKGSTMTLAEKLNLSL